ncbi:MAG: chemotaxis response regulator protein-glutamate methylesterase [Alphaproteobacteria bacterium]
MPNPIRVLVVDDSAFMRGALTRSIEADPRFKVIDTAADGKQAIEKAMRLKPDVVTLDVEMPIMNGIEALKTIVSRSTIPVIMVSAVTDSGAKVTMDALEMGAVDFIPKSKGAELIHEKLLAALSANPARRGFARGLQERIQAQGKGLTQLRGKTDLDPKQKGKPAPERPEHALRPSRPGGLPQPQPQTEAKAPAALRPPAPGIARAPVAPRVSSKQDISYIRVPAKIVVIGSSTGGPQALQEVIGQLPANLPVPVVVAQHMPPQFTTALAKRLDETCQPKVVEARDGEPLVRGTVYIGPGGMHLRVSRDEIRVNESKGESLYKPSVDVLAESVLAAFGKNVLGVMLTGMGNDGMIEFVKLHKHGAYTVAQDQNTCVVYGMPRAIVDAGAANEVLPIEQIGLRIRSAFGL